MSGCGQILTQVRPALIEYLSVLWARTSQALYVWLWSNTDTSSSRAHRVPVSSLGSYKSAILCLDVVKYCHKIVPGSYSTRQFYGLLQIWHSMPGRGQILTQVCPGLIQYPLVLWARTNLALYAWTWSNTNKSLSRANTVPVSSLGSYKLVNSFLCKQ